MSKEWFILQFKSNSHHLAAKNLNQQGFETFLPLHDTTSRKLSRFVNTPTPLFPGYMFIRFDRAESDWYKINNTYGVSRLITFNSILKSVPNILVDDLIKQYDIPCKLQNVKSFKKGDQVTISKGPFANFIATVEKCEEDHRIWVLMDLMGRRAKIQTPSDGLKQSD